MALNFNVLAQVPSVAERFMAGRQAAQEEQQRNMLLQQRQMEFSQAQEDRRRRREQEGQFDQITDLIRQNGMDPDDPQVLGQFVQAALKSRNPQLVSFASLMSERAAKRKQQQAEADALRAALTGRPMGARAAAPAAAVPAAPAAMTQPPAAPAITATTFDEGAARPEMPRPTIAARPAAVEPPMPMGPARELPPPNALVGPALAAEPAANRLTAPADPNAARIAELEAKRDRLEMLGTTKGATLAAQTQRQIDKLKPKEYAPTELERLNAALANLPPGSPQRKVYEARIAKLTEPSKGVTVNLPRQQDEFEKKLGGGQAEKLLKDRDVAEEAVSIIDTVRRGKELLSGPIITGFGAEALTQIGAALNQIGFSFAPDAVANTQAFAANMAQNVGKIIKQFGAGTGLSNADREYAEKMAGGKITLDKAAIQKILDINERAARNVIQAHNKRAAGIKTNIPLTVEMPTAPTARGRVGGEAAASISDERANAQAAIAAGAPEAAVRKRFKEKTGQEL